ncbi:MAG: guanylate kinase [Bacteroidia bacterium]
MNPPKASIFIFSAPSGSGKTTIVKETMKRFNCFEFSVSATTRPVRGKEREGIDYFFLTESQFKNKIDANAFLEWEEVYPGRFYGTLRSEVDRILSSGKYAIFDVDVQGGINIKKNYGVQAVSFFIQPPGIEVLKKRLERRGTDSAEDITRRIAKAEEEMKFAPQFDYIIINDVLEDAVALVEQLIRLHL